MKKLMQPIVVCLLSASFLSAEELQSIPADEVRHWGARLAKSADKLENPQIRIEANSEMANGVHVPDKLGVIIVPQKELKEGEELAAKFKTNSGAALAYLFSYRLVPVVDGKQVDADRLRAVNVTDENGTEYRVYVLLLAVRQLAEDDYRLFGYGNDKKPIVDARFSEGTGPGPVPVAVEIKDPDEQTKEGTVVITVFGKYQANFRMGYTEN